MALIGIDINETITVYLDSDTEEPRTEFVLGLIPCGKLETIRGEYSERTHEERSAETLKVTANLLGSNHEFAYQLCRWGVRGHRGLLNREGADIPYTGDTEAYAGQSYQVASRATLELYGHLGILDELATKTLLYNRLSELQKNG